MSDTQERLTREKEFHNETFAGDTRKAVKKYYKSASQSKDYYHRQLEEDVEGKKVLEYGCGPGSAAFRLAELGGEIHGIDISDVAISQSQEKAEEMGLNIDFQVMDAENLNFGDDTFDLICGSGILHHLDLKRSYSEIRRCLKPGGKAIFFEPLGHNPVINIYRNLTPKMRTDDEHPLLLSDLKLAEDYFGEVEGKYFNLTATAATFLPPLAGALHSIDRAVFKMLPYFRRHAWIVVLTFSKPR
jgi:SAM-dependent methyltransferase